MGSVGGLGGASAEEERGATCCETPYASQPVFCGSSLQDAPSCQEAPWASAEPRDTETPGELPV